MIYAVSDIHGRWEKYRALLERLSREDPDYTLYLLGDSIDRGKGGCRILLDAMKRPNVISLLGNHEFSAAVCLPWPLFRRTAILPGGVSGLRPHPHPGDPPAVGAIAGGQRDLW